MALPDPFPLQRWRIHARVIRPLHWPEYEGSALRGLWGHALRHMVCVTRQPACGGCPLIGRCPYPALFEPAPPPGCRTYGDLTPPYVIEPGEGGRQLRAGDGYAFDVLLFGRALREMDLVQRAWQRALSGAIGPADGAMVIEHFELLDDAVPLPAVGPAPQRAGLELLTPLYVKRQGRPVSPDAFDAATFVWAVVRRVAEVCELHLGQPTGLDFAALKAAAQALRFGAGQWRYRQLRRWSNRQGRPTPLDGIVGSGTLEGDLAPVWPLLHLGQWLHAGGRTSFGLGRYRLHAVA